MTIGETGFATGLTRVSLLTLILPRVARALDVHALLVESTNHGPLTYLTQIPPPAGIFIGWVTHYFRSVCMYRVPNRSFSGSLTSIGTRDSHLPPHFCGTMLKEVASPTI